MPALRPVKPQRGIEGAGSLQASLEQGSARQIATMQRERFARAPSCLAGPLPRLTTQRQHAWCGLRGRRVGKWDWSMPMETAPEPVRRAPDVD